jgi:carboxymethylenebutenolidase
VALAPDYFTPLGVDPGTFDLTTFWVRHTDGAREVMAQALECLKVQPFVARENLGVVGFSLGGYFALIMATHSDVKGVVSYYGAYHGAPVSGVPTRYSWPEIVAQVRTPALILHGDSDSTIPLVRAEGVRRLMEERGKPVEMVVYPGVEHAFDQVGTPTFNASATADAASKTQVFLRAHLR